MGLREEATVPLVRHLPYHQGTRLGTSSGEPEVREATLGGPCGQVGSIQRKGCAGLDGGGTTRMRSCLRS